MDSKSEPRESLNTPTNSPREFNSQFVSDLKVNIANYLVEILLSNFIKFNKIQKPTIAFWQKDKRGLSPEYDELAMRYAIEIPEMFNLLKIFDVAAIAAHFQDSKCTSVKYLKLENRQKLIYGIYLQQLKLLKAPESQEMLIKPKAYKKLKKVNADSAINL